MVSSNVNCISSVEKIPGINDGDAQLVESNADAQYPVSDTTPSGDDASSEEHSPSCSRPSSTSYSTSVPSDRISPLSAISSDNSPLIVTNDGVSWNLEERVIPGFVSCQLCHKVIRRGNQFFEHMMQCLSRQSKDPRFLTESSQDTSISESQLLSMVSDLTSRNTTSKRRYPLPQSSTEHPPSKRQRLQDGDLKPAFTPTYYEIKDFDSGNYATNEMVPSQRFARDVNCNDEYSSTAPPSFPITTASSIVYHQGEVTSELYKFQRTAIIQVDNCVAVKPYGLGKVLAEKYPYSDVCGRRKPILSLNRAVEEDRDLPGTIRISKPTSSDSNNPTIVSLFAQFGIGNAYEINPVSMDTIAQIEMKFGTKSYYFHKHGVVHPKCDKHFLEGLKWDTLESRVRWFNQCLEELEENLPREKISRVVFPYKFGFCGRGEFVYWETEYLPAIEKFAQKVSRWNAEVVIVERVDNKNLKYKVVQKN